MVKLDLSIRLAQEGDLFDISRLYSFLAAQHQVRTRGERFEAIQRAFRKKHTQWIVAEASEGILGFLKLDFYRHAASARFISRDYGYVSAIAVAPYYHRQGIGRKLLMYAEQLLQKKRVSIIELDVAAKNHSAIACYRSLGYINTKRTSHSRRMVKYIPHNEWDKH